MPRASAPTKVKRNCIKNTKTRRCVKSVKRDETSAACQFFNKTERCRSLKEETFVEYKDYKVKKAVKTFLEKKIQKVPLAKLIKAAEKHEDYEFILQDMFENKNKTESQIKNQFEDEILDLASNESRDREGSEVIQLKSLKRVLKTNEGFDFLL
jgi:hypothetical protein